MDRYKLNFLIDIGLLVSGIAVGITGIMKLRILGIHMPALTQIHDFAGVVFVILAATHVILHFNWMLCTAKNMLACQKSKKEKK